MDDQQALAIVTALAHGAHPLTGEVFADGLYQSPEVIRALFVAQRALELRVARVTKVAPASLDPHVGTASQPRRPSRESQASNAGKPWNGDEDAQLLKAFDSKKSIAEIARAHGRTPSGIRARLEKHGRLESQSA